MSPKCPKKEKQTLPKAEARWRPPWRDFGQVAFTTIMIFLFYLSLRETYIFSEQHLIDMFLKHIVRLGVVSPFEVKRTRIMPCLVHDPL